MKHLLLAVHITLAVQCTSSVILHTTHGPVEGKTITLATGKKVDTFLGLPYAAPPIGEKRFSLPQPLEPWNQTRKALDFPASCIQSVTDEMKKTVWYVSEATESEDCLYLNIWKPNQSTKRKMAVMIWIHGGGFTAGSSAMPLYDGSYLATEGNVIVASINYRLGAFGLLYTNTTEAPGNVGIQDQIQAIEWISDNAKTFGGDPKRITLFGESAGSVSVSFHLTNTKMYDLFQFAILESGAETMELAALDTTSALNGSLAFASKIGCDSTNMQQTISCLRNKKAEDLVLKGDIVENNTLPFSPVKNGIQVPFDPFTAAQEIPESKRKNIISGNVMGDMGYFMPEYLPGKTFSDNFTVTEDEENAFLKNTFTLSDPRLQNIVKHEYLSDDETSSRSEKRTDIRDIMADSIMICRQIGFTKGWVTGTNKVYYYYFKYRPSKSTKAPLPKWLGPTHGDELPFVFGLPLDHKNGYTDAELLFSRKVMTLWTNFAKTGNPNGASKTFWPRMKPNMTLQYLNIDMNSKGQIKLTAAKGLKEKICEFWNQGYPSLLGIQEQLDKSKTE